MQNMEIYVIIEIQIIINLSWNTKPCDLWAYFITDMELHKPVRL